MTELAPDEIIHLKNTTKFYTIGLTTPTRHPWRARLGAWLLNHAGIEIPADTFPAQGAHEFRIKVRPAPHRDSA